MIAARFKRAFGRRAARGLASAACVLCVLSAGCVEDGGGRGMPTGASARAHPFDPVRVRVHPLTHFETLDETGRRQVNVHLEMYDRFDHAVKGLGTVLFELYRDRGMTTPGPGARQVMRWPIVDLTDPEENSRPYDPVTRTYRITLTGVPEDLPGEGKLVLHVTFTTSSGERLETVRHEMR